MKKLLLLLLIFISVRSFGQHPVGVDSMPLQTLGNISNLVKAKGAIGSDSGFVNARYPDTIAANRGKIKNYPGAQIRIGNTIWIRDTTATRWILGTGGLPTTIYVKDDLTVDTITNPGFQTLGRLHSDGLVSGGIVTSAGCMDIQTTPASYYLNNGTHYIAPSTILTVGAADLTDPRKDLVVVDTLGQVTIIPGTPSPIPSNPYHNPASQWVINEITVPAGATCLAIGTIIIYDETGGTEYTPTDAGTITADPDNTANPYPLSPAPVKADFVSVYQDGATLIFTKPAGEDTVFNNSVFKWFLYFNGPFVNQLQIQLFVGATAVSSNVVVNPYFNPLDTSQYQIVAVPAFAFGPPGNIIFDKIVFTLAGDDISGVKGFYLDFLQLQTGLNNFTAGKGVLNFTKNATRDSIILTREDGTRFAVLDSSGGGGGGTQNLQQVTDIDSLTTHNMIAGDTSHNFTTIRDSIYQKKNFTTTTTGLKGAMLWKIRTEKYNTTGYDTHGKMGDWNSWLTRNYYNVSRPGEILYPYTYNMNNAGGAILTNEGAFGVALESDYNRGFEWYLQTIMRNGTAYRPIMIVAKKDTIPGSEIGFRTPILHAMYPDTASDYFNAKNGELSVYNIGNRPALIGAGTAIIRLTGYRPMSIYNNGNSLLFGGAASYLFDSAVAPINHNVIDLGGQSNRWRKGFIQGLQTSFTVVPDANYTLLITDYGLSFKNITADRTLTLPTSFTGNTFITGTHLHLNTGQATYKITYSGATVKNPDGTTATELAAGQSAILVYDGTNWQIESTTVSTVAGVTPIANGGTNNGSLSVTAGTVYYGDGTKLVGLAPGTSNQVLHGGTTPSWKDTTAAGGGGGGTPAGNYGNIQINRNSAFDVAGSDSLDYESASGLTLNNIYNSSKTGATASTVYDAFVGTNSTASSLGNPMYGKAFHSIGRAWKVNATAADQSVDMRLFNFTAQGAAAPTGSFYVDFSINGGAFVNAMRVASDGTLITAGPIFGTSGGFTAGLSLTRASVAQTFLAGVNIQATTSATSGVPIQYSPYALFTGHAWDGSATKAADYRLYVKPLNGTSPITSQFILQSQIGGTGYSDVLSVANNGRVVLTNSINLKSYTVATLPATAVVGDVAYVTDATAPTYLAALTGGGAVVCPVFFNGTIWVSH